MSEEKKTPPPSPQPVPTSSTSEKDTPVLTPVYSNDFIFESADHTKKK